MKHLNYISAILFGICSLMSLHDYFEGIAPSESSNLVIGLLLLTMALESLREEK